MGSNTNGVGSLEELTMIAIQSLSTNAYGITINDELKQIGRNISIGSLYVTLGRLEDKGYVRSSMGDPTAERGGRAKKYFVLTAKGVRALEDAEEGRRYLHVLRLRRQGGMA